MLRISVVVNGIVVVSDGTVVVSNDIVVVSDGIVVIIDDIIVIFDGIVVVSDSIEVVSDGIVVVDVVIVLVHDCLTNDHLHVGAASVHSVHVWRASQCTHFVRMSSRPVLCNELMLVIPPQAIDTYIKYTTKCNHTLDRSQL